MCCSHVDLMPGMTCDSDGTLVSQSAEILMESIMNQTIFQITYIFFNQLIFLWSPDCNLSISVGHAIFNIGNQFIAGNGSLASWHVTLPHVTSDTVMNHWHIPGMMSKNSIKNVWCDVGLQSYNYGELRRPQDSDALPLSWFIALLLCVESFFFDINNKQNF